MKKNVYSKLELVLGALLVVVAHHLTYGSSKFDDTYHLELVKNLKHKEERKNQLCQTQQEANTHNNNLRNAVEKNIPLDQEKFENLKNFVINKQQLIDSLATDNSLDISHQCASFKANLSLYSFHFYPSLETFSNIYNIDRTNLLYSEKIEILINIATAYYNGTGTEKNKAYAYHFLDKAVEDLKKSESRPLSEWFRENSTKNTKKMFKKINQEKDLYNNLKALLNPIIDLCNGESKERMTVDAINNTIRGLTRTRDSKSFDELDVNEQFNCFFYQLLLKFINYNLKYKEKQTNTLAEINQLSSAILNNFIIPNSWQYNTFYALFELCNPQILAGSEYRQGKIILKDYMKKLLAPKEYKNLPIYQYLPKDF